MLTTCLEYITTLEGDIAERDRLIDAIRTELGSTKSENVALRQEIDALKKALLDGRGRPDTPVLPPPGPLPVVSAVNRASASSPAPLLAPNTQKDLPTSPRLGARGFWGGAAHGMGGFGSITPVHTTLVPEWGTILNGKGAPGRKSPALQENINPNLNAMPTSLAAFLTGRNEEKSKEQQNPMAGFDLFADNNMFTLKSMDAYVLTSSVSLSLPLRAHLSPSYRMHLWGKMAQQQAAQRQNQPSSQGQSNAPAPTGLAGNVRPHYFNKSPTLSALLSGKAVTSSVTSSSQLLHPYPTPPSSPHLGAAKADAPTAQHAMLASMASQTLFSKLGNAFWDAFSRPSGGLHPNGASKQEWDADKVRRVMEGTAVVRIVDVDPHPTPKASTASMAQKVQEKDKCTAVVADLLAESMASLTLSRK